tara:strand:+ start:5525 stop:5980 length:456 start_codon:yes stop_codon:yes gene_type:complete
MKNNDIIKRLRYILSINDLGIFDIISLSGSEEKRSVIRCWFLKDDHPEFQSCPNKQLHFFLNGLIIQKRGSMRQESQYDYDIDNNIILKKLRIIFNLTTDDIIDLLLSEDYKLSKHEMSAFFRSPNHKNYRLCKDQLLRNFLNALQKKYSH